MLVNTTLYIRDQYREIKVALEISHTPFQKGDMTTPDTPEHVELEAVWYNKVLLAFDDPIFLEADDVDYLMTFVEEEQEAREAAKYEHFLEQREMI